MNGVNCPACGRFMRHKENETFVIEHTHNMFTAEREYTHTHGIEVEVWVCGCGFVEKIETFEEHSDHAIDRMTVNTFENTERF